MDNYSYLSNAHPDAIEDLYNTYLNNPDALEHGWKKFFEGFEFARTNFNDGGAVPENIAGEIKVMNLIAGYRQRGHLFTKTNPVRERRKYSPTLDIENFGLTQADMEKTFQAGSQIGIGTAKLKDIVAHLQQTYCQSIGVEYMYMRNPEVVSWLQEKMEGSKNTPQFSIEEKKTILNKLNQAVVFENFLATKFVGQKRFSLEGGEALIPAFRSGYGAPRKIECFGEHPQQNLQRYFH
jgi:2-oxoglutarate dehydrogenase E1 component